MRSATVARLLRGLAGTDLANGSANHCATCHRGTAPFRRIEQSIVGPIIRIKTLNPSRKIIFLFVLIVPSRIYAIPI